MADATIPMADAAVFQLICGNFDENLRIIERELAVTITNHADEIHIHGNAANVDLAKNALQSLQNLAQSNQPVSAQTTRSLLQSIQNGEDPAAFESAARQSVCFTATGAPVHVRTKAQSDYVRAISSHTITFGVGPAGTGKTFLAVAMAVRAFRHHDVDRIILTRPAVEAGEKLGFLPGDLQEKVDPYLRPLYDALFELFGADAFERHSRRGTIEVAPLAYMRGRTLDHAFIILDEAQNTTNEQMKMFLTRLGEESHMVITGDPSQIDLPDKQKSGLVIATRILRKIPEIAVCEFSPRDVVRHKLVQDIVCAYDGIS